MDESIMFNPDNKPCDCYNDYFCENGGLITLELRLEIKSIYYYPKINFCPICGKKLVIDEV